MAGIEVVYYGPLFDGRAEKACDDACKEMAATIAREGVDMIDTQLNAVLRKQTPLYRLRINARREHPSWVINDRDCIYGPWLEGTGSRNKTTRFKGYATFRKITQKLNRRSRLLSRPVLARYKGRIG